MIEIGEKSPKNEDIFNQLLKSTKPILMLINKIDKSSEEEVAEAVEHWSQLTTS